MRRQAVWLVTLPLALTGMEGAHALANALTGSSDGEIFSSPSSGQRAIPFVVALLAGIVFAALAARVRGWWLESRSARSLALPFAFVPPVGFLLVELAEGVVSTGGFSWRAVFCSRFALGLSLQLPVGLVGYLVARGLLRLSDRVRSFIARRSQPVPSGSRPDATPRGHDEVRRLGWFTETGRGRAPPVGSVCLT